ncbi:neutral zinc metallopeptidase [Nocardia goodfellowii]|uniref:Metalloprotease n=1 Tax=Nocardia goodfellowii TaxID=882446 RepID=A0ABS4QQ78_9NOCA|nr:metallopeptidase [Nocardia goodfellowii]MBP2193872.1 putative metalloprotease [Nocardia goodfellowii]
MRLWRFGVVAVVLAVGAALSGCAEVVNNATGKGVSDSGNPWVLAGAAKAEGPSGPREGVPDTALRAENSDGGAVDKLALNAIADIEAFWKSEYAKTFPGIFQPVTAYVSWDAKAAKQSSPTFCRSSTYQLVNAAYCGLDHTIGWDRGILFPLLEQKYNSLAIVMVLAHEYGHAIQGQAKIAGFFTNTLVQEQQADCLAGVFLRHVAEGDSPHFTMNLTDGLDGVLGATIAVRDTDPGSKQNMHGSAFERVTAVQLGYTDGASACKQINRSELNKRRGSLPTSFEFEDEEQRQLPIDRESLASVAQALSKAFPVSKPPVFDYRGVVRDCAKVSPTEPVSYCPSSNTIGTDVVALAERGEKQNAEDVLSADVDGDYNAFIVFISRYMLAVQHDRRLGLTGAETAGLRTVCLSGAFTTKLSAPNSDPRLSAKDLDEAVSGLLADGLAAADVDGKIVKSGYQRLEAFRHGVLDGERACLTKFE